jgi:hypothetical protein
VRSLDRLSVQALLDSLALPGVDAPALSEALLQHTGGNPLFILETLRTLLARGATAVGAGARDLPLPASVGELIARRLQQLSRPAGWHVAALAGQTSMAPRRNCWSNPITWQPMNELEAADAAGIFAHDLASEGWRARYRGVRRACIADRRVPGCPRRSPGSRCITGTKHRSGSAGALSAFADRPGYLTPWRRSGLLAWPSSVSNAMATIAGSLTGTVASEGHHVET